MSAPMHASSIKLAPTNPNPLTGDHEPGEQMLRLAYASPKPHFTRKAKRILKERLQAVPGKPGCFRLVPLQVGRKELRRLQRKGVQRHLEEVVVFDNGIPGLSPDEVLVPGATRESYVQRMHPTDPRVFASIGRHSLRLVRSPPNSRKQWARIEVIRNDPELLLPIPMPEP